MDKKYFDDIQPVAQDERLKEMFDPDKHTFHEEIMEFKKQFALNYS